MKQLLVKSIFFVIIAGFVHSTSAFAVTDPRSVPNNQFGIHIVDPTDIHGVTELINSNGAAWGYVKVVIPETDRNTDKWNSIFKEFRRKKLIPIVRLATQAKGAIWTKPTPKSIDDWPDFLNSLSWPVQNRYVVLFNEPNHAKEWGGEINPEEFGNVTVDLAKKLKATSADFFILPAGFDVSAASDGLSLDAENYIRRIVAANPEFLSVLDGWNSHSYPNPAFSASPQKTGRGSLRSYEWELTLLRELGETRDLPVLIGETGWTHSDGVEKKPGFLLPDTVASYYEQAGNTVWKDRRIFAVTPFLYNYQGEPFAHFSFRKYGGAGYHPHYFSYLNLPKIAGAPVQRESYLLTNDPLPDKLVAGSSYTFPVEFKNTGQAIISSLQNYILSFDEPTQSFSFSFHGLPEVEPDQTVKTYMTIHTPNEPGSYAAKLTLKQYDKVFDLAFTAIELLPPPTLTLTAQLGWQRTSDATAASVLIYDGDTVLYEFKDLPVNNGIIVTPGVLDIVPERSYRIVTLIPYYLPRQVIQQINDQVTFVTNNRFFPFDTNNNQQLDPGDIVSLLTSPPATILPRFFGN